MAYSAYNRLEELSYWDADAGHADQDSNLERARKLARQLLDPARVSEPDALRIDDVLTARLSAHTVTALAGFDDDLLVQRLVKALDRSQSAAVMAITSTVIARQIVSGSSVDSLQVPGYLGTCDGLAHALKDDESIPDVVRRDLASNGSSSFMVCLAHTYRAVGYFTATYPHAWSDWESEVEGAVPAATPTVLQLPSTWVGAMATDLVSVLERLFNKHDFASLAVRRSAPREWIHALFRPFPSAMLHGLNVQMLMLDIRGRQQSAGGLGR